MPPRGCAERGTSRADGGMGVTSYPSTLAINSRTKGRVADDEGIARVYWNPINVLLRDVGYNDDPLPRHEL